MIFNLKSISPISRTKILPQKRKLNLNIQQTFSPNFRFFCSTISQPEAVSKKKRFIVFGLGNPGRDYENTRHNAGFLCIDQLQKDLNFPPLNSFQARTYFCQGIYNDSQIYLAQPQTMMNLSGDAIHELSHLLDVPSKHLIIIYDDAHIPLGEIRIRNSGSSGGQNGIKHIINKIPKADFIRVRFGIGLENGRLPANLISYVLKNFNAKEIQIVDFMKSKVSQAVQCLLKEGLNSAMNKFNKKWV